MQQVARQRSAVLAYLQLLRLPNVFTVVADVTMGFLFVHYSLEPTLSFACLLAASCSLYLAGMVLNDLYDVDIDRQQRPTRPLPSGRVSLMVARNLGWGLLGLGWMLSIAAAFLPAAQRHMTYAPALSGTLLAVAIVAYDTGLKQTVVGPIVMGLCRFLNVLLAMSLVKPSEQSILYWGPAHLVAAGAIGFHIAGVTWFARDEAGQSRRSTLLFGLALIIVGWVLLGWLPNWLPPHRIQLERVQLVNMMLPMPKLWYLFVPILGAPLARRLLVAVFDTKTDTVQTAVRHGIWSLVWMDASIALLIAPPVYAVAIVMLFIPMLLLGRWVYST